MRANSILGFGNRSTASGLREAKFCFVHDPLLWYLDYWVYFWISYYEASVNWSKFSERPQRHLAAGAHAL